MTSPNKELHRRVQAGNPCYLQDLPGLAKTRTNLEQAMYRYIQVRVYRYPCICLHMNKSDVGIHIDIDVDADMNGKVCTS